MGRGGLINCRALLYRVPVPDTCAAAHICFGVLSNLPLTPARETRSVSVLTEGTTF